MKIYVYAHKDTGLIADAVKELPTWYAIKNQLTLIGEAEKDVQPIKREVTKEIEARRWNDHYVSAIIPPDAKNVKVTFTTNE